MGDTLPTARLARQVRAVIALAEELDSFAAFLEARPEIDPAAPPMASGMGSLHARLEGTVEAARKAQSTAAFFVRHGREAAA